MKVYFHMHKCKNNHMQVYSRHNSVLETRQYSNEVTDVSCGQVKKKNVIVKCVI